MAAGEDHERTALETSARHVLLESGAKDLPRQPWLHASQPPSATDLATPFGGADYEFRHMALEPRIAANVRYTYYEAGHMMYIDPPSARKLKDDLAAFYASAL